MRQAVTAADCPMTPPAHASVYAKALHRACLIVGGVDQLAATLQAPRAAVERWIRGEEQPAEKAFLAAVEIILLYASASAKAS